MSRQIVSGLKLRARVGNAEMAHEFADLGGCLFRSSVRLIKPGHGLFRTPSQFAFVSLHMSASGP